MRRLLLLAGWVGIAGAQEVKGIFRGVVLRDSTLTPIAGVEVIIEGAATTHTGDDGRFLIAGIAPGTYGLHFRHPSYRPQDGIILFSGAGAVERRVVMVPLPPTLPKVEVEAEKLRLHLRDFQRRREKGIGKFLTADDFKDRMSASLAAILRSDFPGFLHVVPLRSGKTALATRRAAMTGVAGRVSPTDWCYMQVIVDGERLFVPKPDASPEVAPDMDRFFASEILAVEIYRDALETPDEFGGNGAQCGTIVIWTGKKS